MKKVIIMMICTLIGLTSCDNLNLVQDSNSSESRSVASTAPELAIDGHTESVITLPLINNEYGYTFRIQDLNAVTNKYFVSVQLSDANGNRYGKEYVEWFGASMSNAIKKGNFYLIEYCMDKGLYLRANQYYRVKIATDDEQWEESSKLLHITEPMPGTCDSYMPQQGRLWVNEYMESSNGKYRLVLQEDGHLVLYRVSGWKALWTTPTWGDNVYCVNFSLSDRGVLALAGKKDNGYWTDFWTNEDEVDMPWGAPYMKLQDNGNLVIKRGLSEQVFWETGTAE